MDAQPGRVVMDCKPRTGTPAGVSWNPLAQLRQFDVILHDPFAVSDIESRQFVKANPGRLCFYVLFIEGSVNYNILPMVPAEPTTRHAFPETPIYRIHTAEYPGVCQGEWHISGDNGNVVRVIEVVTLKL